MLPRKYIWKKKSKLNHIDEMEHIMGQSKLVSSILYNRGITEKEEIQDFLTPTVEQLYDPYLLNDMEVAVKRIVTAIENREKITIYGDYDVDGVTSTSILYMYLRSVNGDVDYYIPERLSEGYGMNEAAIRYIKESGSQLVISVDTGITAVHECQVAKEIDLDVVITDHHECQSELPDAFAIINPKRPDNTYPYTMLAGVGVTYKLIQALAQVHNKQEEILEYIDLVAVGTISDIVPLLDENRVIAYFGLRKIMNTNNLGLRELLKVAGYDFEKKISSRYVGFMVGPRINAGGRMGDAKRGVELFTSNDPHEAYLLAHQMNEENNARQVREREIQEEAIRLIEDSSEIQNSKIMVVSSTGWHHGVIGIVSSRIKDLYYRPNLILTVDEEGIASGSARSVEGFNLFKALESCKDILLKFGGHEAAAGLSLDASNIPELHRRLNEYADEYMTEDTLIPKLTIDDELTIPELDIDSVNSLSRLEPYGQSMEEAIFGISGVIEEIKAIGKDGNTLRLNISENGQRLTAIGFKMAYFEPYFIRGNRITIAGSLSINEFNGRKSIQMMLKDMKFDNQLVDYNKLDYLLMEGKFMDYIVDHNIKIEKGDCVEYYKILRNLWNKEATTFSIVNTFTVDNQEDLLKVLVVLEIFQELGIIHYQATLPYIKFSINPGVRVQLEDSIYYRTIA